MFFIQKYEEKKCNIYTRATTGQSKESAVAAAQSMFWTESLNDNEFTFHLAPPSGHILLIWCATK